MCSAKGLGVAEARGGAGEAVGRLELGDVVDAHDLVGDALEHEGPRQRDLGLGARLLARELVCVPVRRVRLFRVRPRLLAPRRGLRELQPCLLELPPRAVEVVLPVLPLFLHLGQVVQHALQRLGAGVLEEVLDRLHDDAVNARVLV
ncbi:hypothetical protein DL766_008252 [Monosporascus sp. MC13-8B]|uniref:Uncharacterized protein n=1 Tax=Monosporascus cannonballus TaxID=155416 RepID=A0ABY0HBL2_9PEZI|nr:hypothetical protein DL763_010889 [Monosporascus cannonballus]RYO89372.1 hypothetical protein DL762_003263 [Monosporascus cannonballus]RYP20155.1 hypothetical protein DL766_008252 [Monosporascus sp. MC13-8B]